MTKFTRDELEKRLRKMTHEELRALVLINSYKLAMARSQIEVMSEVLIKNKLTTYESLWKKTHEHLRQMQEEIE